MQFLRGTNATFGYYENILKNSQILIFDEATANIDEKRRGRFYQLLHELSGDKIIIFLRTIWKNCERQMLLWIWRSYIIRQVSEK